MTPENRRSRGESAHGVVAEAFDTDLARAAVALILGGQRPPFEGRSRVRMDEARWSPAAELAGAGTDCKCL